jgi:hypothetical protein
MRIAPREFRLTRIIFDPEKIGKTLGSKFYILPGFGGVVSRELREKVAQMVDKTGAVVSHYISNRVLDKVNSVVSATIKVKGKVKANASSVLLVGGEGPQTP